MQRREASRKRGHDVRGRTVKTVRYLAKTGATYTNLYAHDDANRTVRHTPPGGALVVTNTFDTGLNLATVARLVGGSPQAFSTATGFNEVGQLSGLNFGNGKVTTHTYHPRSRRLAAISTPGAQALAYTYDAVSNVKSITDSAGAGAQSATLTGLNYDDLHRLVALNSAAQGAKSFTYSAIGNTTLNGEAGAGAYNYGTGGQLPHAVRSANGKTYAYDAAGNMVSRAGQALSYDAENRLIEVRTNGAVLATFGYDAEGMRLWKETATNTQVWIGDTYEEKNGKALFHVFAGTRRVVTLDSVALAGPVAGEVVHYYHPDHLGSTTTLTDRNGALVERTVNSAFGREWSTSGSAFRLSNRFTGQVADDETGLYYYGARYYDPELARFIQPDTIIPDVFNPQSWNRYSYTLNNPLKYTDPSGHHPLLVFLVAGLFLSGADNANAPADVSQGLPAQGAGNMIGFGLTAAQGPAGLVREVAPHVLADGIQQITGREISPEVIGAVGNPRNLIKNSTRSAASKTDNAADALASVKAPKPGVPAAKAEVTVSSPAGKTPHGNSKASPNPQHRYEIMENSSGDVVKTGISGKPMNKNGTSGRANEQVNKLNTAEGAGTYSARVPETNLQGRQAGLNAERAATTQLDAGGNSLRLQKRPKP